MVLPALAAELSVLELRKQFLVLALRRMEVVLAVYVHLDILFGALGGVGVVLVSSLLLRLHLKEAVDMQKCLLLLRLEVLALLVVIVRRVRQLDLRGILVVERIEKYRCRCCPSGKALVVEVLLLRSLAAARIVAADIAVEVVELVVVLLPFDLAHSILEKKRLRHNCECVADTVPWPTIALVQHLRRKSMAFPSFDLAPMV